MELTNGAEKAEMTKEMDKINFHLTKELKVEFEKAADLENSNMTRVLTGFIQQFISRVRQDKKKAGLLDALVKNKLSA